MKKYSFPDKFLWGSAFSGPQTEGAFAIDGKTPTIWDHWFKIKKNRFFEGMNVKNDFYHKYETDSKIMGQMGLNGLVYNLDWTRVMLINDSSINMEGIIFYKNVFASLKANNVQIIPILFHWDTPLWAEAYGGWTNRKILDSFRIFCQTMFEQLGKTSDIWYVNDENSTFTLLGYLSDYLPPAKNNTLDTDHKN
ncbi:family 1 glycosylhydrolase [Spiroplasma endosymbiont of Nebria brevicollis]|uniref:family 1 glycosylhydrolase n=1 Tax=Spiroplasma endosymbiont of Nebria brevicollis TaxID=3066284 RepID=UPI00313BE242